LVSTVFLSGGVLTAYHRRYRVSESYLPTLCSSVHCSHHWLPAESTRTGLSCRHQSQVSTFVGTDDGLHCSFVFVAGMVSPFVGTPTVYLCWDRVAKSYLCTSPFFSGYRSTVAIAHPWGAPLGMFFLH
jgi:hypothetical protein